MDNSPLADDIEFVRQMAEDGASAPSLGGRFAVWWGALVSVALVCHYATVTGQFPLQQNMVGLIWVIMAVVGMIGNVVLGRALSNKPGLSAPGNRAESAVWPVITAGIFLYATAIGFAVTLRDQPALLFNTIIPMAFILHAVGAAVGGSLHRRSTPWFVVAASLILAALAMFWIDRPEIYLLAAAGIVITQIIPGLIDLRAEPKSVV